LSALAIGLAAFVAVELVALLVVGALCRVAGRADELVERAMRDVERGARAA
jgi:hypothetical protein